VRLVEQRLGPIANGRRQLEDDPAVIEPLKVARQLRERGGVRLDDDADVPRGHLRRLILRQSLRGPPQDADRGRPQDEGAEADEEPSHQWGTSTSRWIVEGLLSRVAK